MKKAVIVGLVVLLVIGSAVALYGKAEKSDLATAVYKNPSPTGASVGFATLNNPSGKNFNLIVVVSLKAGMPNTKYFVYLEKYDSAGTWLDWVGPIGELDTDPNGRGNVNLKWLLKPGGLYCLQVVLADAGGNWIFANTMAPINLK